MLSLKASTYSDTKPVERWKSAAHFLRNYVDAKGIGVRPRPILSVDSMTGRILNNKKLVTSLIRADVEGSFENSPPFLTTRARLMVNKVLIMIAVRSLVYFIS